jgi:hypothetical protein
MQRTSGRFLRLRTYRDEERHIVPIAPLDVRLMHVGR